MFWLRLLGGATLERDGAPVRSRATHRRRIAVLAILAEGEVRVTASDGQVIAARADDGFLSVDNDVVTIVAGDAELV